VTVTQAASHGAGDSIPSETSVMVSSSTHQKLNKCHASAAQSHGSVPCIQLELRVARASHGDSGSGSDSGS
jgi:hypothetical protein